jgi:uncharacterized membrane protein YbhN (UPF0104 family)
VSPGWIKAGRLAFSIAVGIALVVVAVDAVRDLNHVSLRIDGGWLAVAYPLALLAFPLLAIGWASLLRGYGHSLRVTAAVRLWALAQASRYLPTGLAAVASRAVLAARYGVPRTLTVATIVVEGGLLVAWSSLAAGGLVIAGGHAYVIPVAAAGALGVIGLPLGLLVAAHMPGARLSALVRRITGRDGPPSAAPLVTGTLIVGVNMAVKGFVFLLLARALLPAHTNDIALLFGAVNLAVIGGMIGVTPAGIGVREGILAALLSPRFGAGDATALALALRVWDLSVELPWVLGAIVANRRRPATPPPE